MHQSFETPAPPIQAWAGHSLFMQVKVSEVPRETSEWFFPLFLLFHTDMVPR